MIVTNYTPEDFKKLPLRAIVALAARCARRVEHLAELPDGHPAKEQCRMAAANVAKLAEDFAAGRPCPSVEAALKELDDARAIAKGSFVCDSALATFVMAGRAAANAIHAAELSGESAESHSVGAHAADPIGNLADVTADLAARAAFTAAFEAVAAEGHTDPFIKAAIDDYERLLRLDLGRFPQSGKPIDPSSSGRLGPLGL
jgi:hypothetical protein